MLTKLVSLIPLILALVYAVSPSAPHALAVAIPIALAVLGAVWSVSTAILPHLDPAGRPYAILSVVGSDVAVFVKALGDWKPPVPPASIFAFAFAFVVGCAFIKGTVEPVLSDVGKEFVTCVEANVPEELIDLAKLDAVGEVAIAAKCLGVAITDEAAKANASGVHAIVQAKIATKLRRASTAAPCASTPADPSKWDAGPR